MVACASRRARTMPVRSPLTSVIPALSIATSAPVPMAMPTSACGQRRRVVHAVARHGDHRARRLQLAHQLRLVLRQHLGADLVDPEPAGHRLRRALVVAGRHHDAEAEPVQRLKRRRRRLLHRIGHRDEPGERPVHHHEHHRLAPVAPGVRLGRLGPARARGRPASPRCRAPRPAPRPSPARPSRSPPRSRAPRRAPGPAPPPRARSPPPADAPSRAPGWPPAAAAPPRRCPASGSTAISSACPRSAYRSCRRSACRPWRSVSSASASLDQHARPGAPRPVAVMIDIGVASPSAQGQAMISTEIAETSA